jgi:hypothetical protein
MLVKLVYKSLDLIGEVPRTGQKNGRSLPSTIKAFVDGRLRDFFGLVKYVEVKLWSVL